MRRDSYDRIVICDSAVRSWPHMRLSVRFALVGLELGIISWWVLGIRFETGLDSLQYHRMASAIVVNGLAPWVVSPLSYIGIYPGSDSSAVPFLAASLALASGISMPVAVLTYDAILMVVFGLGIFLLTRKVTGKTHLALAAVVTGSFAYGFITTLSWSLDERSFNVALTPIFLWLTLSFRLGGRVRETVARALPLGLTGLVMFSSHLSFILLLPFVVLVPLLSEVVRLRFAARRKRRASVLYFGSIALLPLLIFIVLDQAGVLTEFGLTYQFESSALFSGSSPFIFLANTLVFVGTRVGPVNLLCSLLGLVYLSSRPSLLSRNVSVGGLLLSGLLGLPVVLYSKDLLTPVVVLVATIGIGSLMHGSARRQVVTFALATAVIVSGSVVFNAWNDNRAAKSVDGIYWALPGVTQEAQIGSAWIHDNERTMGCAYGNNPVMLWQVSTGGGTLTCSGVDVDALINKGISAVRGPPSFTVRYVGILGVSPSKWFDSPELVKMSEDFARLPFLSYTEGRSLLLEYGTSLIVVDLRKPYDTPLYQYQGTRLSPFFIGLWDNSFVLYRSNSFAIFQLY